MKTEEGRRPDIQHARPSHESSESRARVVQTTVKKHYRAQRISVENYFPDLYLVNVGGAYLILKGEVLPDGDHLEQITFNQAKMSAAGISPI